MSLPRFHVPPPLAASGRIPLPDDVAHHAGRVLRLPAGAPVVLFDGTGGEYTARLAFEGARAFADLLAHRAIERELAGTLRLVQGIASGDKMEWIIEKAVELGAAQIQPVAARRSVLRLQGERLAKRLGQWRRTAVAAAEQCGRNRIPEVLAPCTLEQWLRDAPPGLLLVCDPEAELGLAEALATASPEPGVSLLVGPEGGWAPEERAAASAAGALQVRFGARVLRTETAGITLLAAASVVLGWHEPG